MKPIKLLGILTHAKREGRPDQTSGVDWARVVNPIEALNNVPGFITEVRMNPFTEKEPNWDAITKNWDIIYSSYIDSDWGYVSMKMACDKNHCLHIIDLDDDIWNVKKDSPVYQVYHKGEQGAMTEALYIATSIISDVSYITTTNTYLKYKIVENTTHRHETIKTFPNMANFKEYDYNKLDRKPKDMVTIGWHGSGTHFLDLVDSPFTKGLDNVMNKYPNVEILTTGMFLPQFKSKYQSRYRHIMGATDFFKWSREVWPQMYSEVDIAVAPLQGTTFDKSKSYIKFLEISAAKVPSVVMDTDPYQPVIKNGVNGFICKSAEDWTEALSKLIESKELRKQIGGQAYQDCLDKYMVEDGAKLYGEWFKEVLAKYKKSV